MLAQRSARKLPSKYPFESRGGLATPSLERIELYPEAKTRVTAPDTWSTEWIAFCSHRETRRR